MIKYIALSIKTIQEKRLTATLKIMFGVLCVLTKKGTVKTTASNKYLGNILEIKSDSQISTMLKALVKIGFVEVSHSLGRRQIGLKTKSLIDGGYLSELRK